MKKYNQLYFIDNGFILRLYNSTEHLNNLINSVYAEKDLQYDFLEKYKNKLIEEMKIQF